jgi:hypothetical protein
MTNTQTLIAEVYFTFNQRNIDGALALMTESVSWPKASEGGRVVGKEEIRAYWSRQWKEVDPHVAPIEVIAAERARSIRVHQLVKSLGGDVLSDSEVWHSYTIDGQSNEWTSKKAKQTLSRARPQRSPITRRRRDSWSDLQVCFADHRLHCVNEGFRKPRFLREIPVFSVAKVCCVCLSSGNRFSQRSLSVRFLTFGVVTPVWARRGPAAAQPEIRTSRWFASTHSLTP